MDNSIKLKQFVTILILQITTKYLHNSKDNYFNHYIDKH